MKIMALRKLVIVLGSVAAGAWASRPISALVTRALSSSAQYNGTGTVVTVALLASAAHFVGAGVAGLVLGMVADGKRTAWWLVILLAMWILWMSGPPIWRSQHVDGPLLSGLAFQALIGCLIAAAAFWLGGRLRGPEAVA